MSYADWKKLWLDNYNGKTDAAKEVAETMAKKNYKGHLYVPWAVMVKWLYLFDESASIDVRMNTNGGFVFSDVGVIEERKTENMYKIAESKTSVDNTNNKEVYSTHKSNFVVVVCSFMGKIFAENYPIQDNSYNAPMYYDSNMVNKAIQRAKAKVISTATGLAFSLYESGDLQFEDDSTVKDDKKAITITKPSITNTALEVETSVKKEVEKSEVDVATPAELAAIYITSHKDETMNKVLQTYNSDFVKNYKFSVSADEDYDSIVSKLKLLPRADLFYKTLVKKYETGIAK